MYTEGKIQKQKLKQDIIMKKRRLGTTNKKNAHKDLLPPKQPTQHATSTQLYASTQILDPKMY